MAVKDLIGRFESSRMLSSNPRPQRSSRQETSVATSSPLAKSSYGPFSDQPSSIPMATTRDTVLHDGTPHEIDITDELRDQVRRQGRLFTADKEAVEYKHELDALLPQERWSSEVKNSTLTRRTPSSYDTDDLESPSISTLSNPTQVSRLTELLPASHKISSNAPIPASTVFAREAAPISLPRLDKYISALPAPSFPTLQAVPRASQMFPPMDRLASSKRTLEDLEHNLRVAPSWRNRNSILSWLVDVVLGITGSSALASFYSLQGLVDTLQIFALLVTTLVFHNTDGTDGWRKLLLGTIPNIITLHYLSNNNIALILLSLLILFSWILLYLFYRATSVCCHLGIPEGLQQKTYMTKGWGVVLISFVLTVVYLPLSTMCIHVLVWSEDLWAVPNPYINATSYPPNVEPLGPSNEFRDPLDFCYTTTMKRNEVNFAPIIMILAAFCFLGLTLWFPIHLRQSIQQVVPIVDPYTELGILRNNSEFNREYQRLLDRDRNPLTFLYRGFRRGWGTYEAVSLFAKLATLGIVAIVDPDTCLFRSSSRTNVAVARQVLLVVVMLVFFILQCVFAPFLNPVQNASEWTSRLSFVVTAAVSLGVVLQIPGNKVLNGAVLYIIYVITYGLGIYFTIINTSFMRRFVKRLARRIDFSIDIFSPRIDLSSSSPHTKRRIWQEAITTLFLTSPDCAIPKDQPMEFAQARDIEYPPYLLGFSGSPGERHVENLKILREVGSVDYNKAVSLLTGPDRAWFQHLEKIILDNFIGPDCYWRNPAEQSTPGCTKFFGNAWWLPFPPTIVVRYDDGSLAVLREVSDLQLYVTQNSSLDIQRRREVRMALRALDGRVVQWPYVHTTNVGSRSPWCCGGRRYHAQTAIHFRSCTFSITRRGQLIWEGLNLGSGFDIKLVYRKDIVVDGDIIGLNDDYDLTEPLARFLALNEQLIPDRLAHIEAVLHNYRSHQRRECEWKASTLTYRFLALVYDRPREPTGLAQSSMEYERDLRVRQLMVSSEAVFDATYERLAIVSRSEIATWWYIFWDDLWRRNYDTISALKTHAADFDPHYPTSIAYSPLPRAALEAFLAQRGLLHSIPKWGDFFHAGLLNKIYLRMNDIVFHGSKGAHIFHLGNNVSELDMEEIDLQTQAQPSTIGTGGGTDHDDESIRARPIYRWEGILEDPLRTHERRTRELWAKVGVWFGVTPLWRAGVPSKGLALDVRLENGRYVLMENDSPPRGTAGIRREFP